MRYSLQARRLAAIRPFPVLVYVVRAFRIVKEISAVGIHLLKPGLGWYDEFAVCRRQNVANATIGEARCNVNYLPDFLPLTIARSPKSWGATMSSTKKSGGERPVSKRPKYVLKLKVEGPGVHRRSIAIPALLKICGAIQSAVHRQAEAMEKPTAQTLRRGPITVSAQEECTLELIGISGGSTGLLFRYAKPQQQLPMPDAAHFGLDVLVKIAETVRDLGTKKQAGVAIDPGVLDSLNELGDVLDKKAITRISLSVPQHNGRHSTIKAILNTSVRERIAARVKNPTQSQLTIEGKLEMADFKELGKTCRIHPPVGLPLHCSFEPELEDQVYAALRKPVRLAGIARLNPNTGRPEELKIEKLEILEELLLGEKEFFALRSLEQLAQTQGVRPLVDPNELAGGWPQDENIDEFIAATYESRS
jgi:hypothetical protein